MNNGDMPASPGPSIPEMVQLKGASVGVMTTEYVTVNGLTKREHFAAMAMQAFCSMDATEGSSYEYLADKAVDQADALLEALETKEEG